MPTVAIENVYYRDNTSVMQEEVFAHRLGLVPLAVDADLMESKGEGDAATASNTLVFKLDVAAADSGVANVMSGSLQWVPHGDQSARFAGREPAPVDKGILLCKLKPGQRISVEAWAVKGVGMEHAKWSPVCTASYRLLPEISLTQEVWLGVASLGNGAVALLCHTFLCKKFDHFVVAGTKYDDHVSRFWCRLPQVIGGKAAELKSKCPMSVFDVEDLGGQKKLYVLPADYLQSSLAVVYRGCMRCPGVARAVVARPRNCTMCRECIREPEWAPKIKLARVADHFICT